jgi:hypothetical protein
LGTDGNTNTKLSVCESQTLNLILGMLQYLHISEIGFCPIPVGTRKTADTLEM